MAEEIWATPLQMALIIFVSGAEMFSYFPFYMIWFGGGAHLLFCAIFLFVLGNPLLNLQILLGQFTGSGCVGVWRAFPLAKGLGITLLFWGFVVICQSGVYLSSQLVFVCQAISPLNDQPFPWMRCNNSWNTIGCGIEIQEPHIINSLDSLNAVNAVSVDSSFIDLKTHPTDQYAEYLQSYRDGLSPARVTSLLALWVFVAASLAKGLRSLALTTRVSVPLTLICLLVLLCRGVSLPGASIGLLRFFKADWSASMMSGMLWRLSLQSSLTWSSMACFGVLLIIGKHADRGAFAGLAATTTTLTLLAASVIRSAALAGFVGFHASTTNSTIEETMHHASFALPVVVADWPAARFWILVDFVLWASTWIPNQALVVGAWMSTFEEILPPLPLAFRSTPGRLAASAIFAAAGFAGGVGILAAFSLTDNSAPMYGAFTVGADLQVFVAFVVLYLLVAAVAPIGVSRVINGVDADLLSFVARQRYAVLASSSTTRRRFTLFNIGSCFVALPLLLILGAHKVADIVIFHIPSVGNLTTPSGVFALFGVVFVVVVALVSTCVVGVVSVVRGRGFLCPRLGWNPEERDRVVVKDDFKMSVL